MSVTSTSTAVWTMLTDRWRTSIRAKNLSHNTERGYTYTAHRWAEWLEQQNLDVEPDEVRPHHVDDFIADIVTSTSAANAAHHYRNLRVFFAWLHKRGAMTTNPMDKTEPPNVPEKIIPVLSDDEHTRVLATCNGKDFFSLRDMAIILMLIDTGLRVSELASLDVSDVELGTRRFLVNGKGNRPRWVGFSNGTGLALARYLRKRDKQDGSDSDALWLSRRGERLAIAGVQSMVARRGELADVSGKLHPHRFRHDFSHRWQQAGGSESGLMMIAGWSSTKMPRHYGKQAAAQRALAEHSRLGLVDQIA